MKKFKVRFYSRNTEKFHVMEIESTGDHISRIRAAIRKEVMKVHEYYYGIRIMHIQKLPEQNEIFK
jgi:hypothetical protein